jgi:two-component system sensor histidine kinase/response regulator
VASGQEALDEIERADKDKPFELVVMDWKMPGMDGIEASRQIKTHKTLSKIPAIILVTAHGREEIMQQADEIGLEGFLLKPVNSSVLFDAIMQALGKEVQDPTRVRRGKERTPDDLKAIQGARVLLVEDNEINQQVAKEILEGAGLVVTIANDGREGVDLVQSSEFDAVLMDIQMPVMDGYTATRKIREWEVGMRNGKGRMRNGKGRMRNAECGMRNRIGEDSDLKSEIRNHKSEIKRLPIIAMTAHAMAGDEQKSIEAGMDGHVTKPIDPDQLFAALQKWIKPVEERAAVPKSLSASGRPPVLDALPEPDQALSAEDELPESLPGFDLHAGLARLMGNKRLYRKLLLDFGANYGGVADEIRQALAAGDFEQAHSLVHNIKGLAGNLEATDLQAAAVKIEKLVKGQSQETVSEKDLQENIAELENSLNRALDAVQTLGPPAEEKIIEPSAKWLAEVPVEQVREVVNRIKAAAEMGDVTQIKSIAEELKSEFDAMETFCDELVRLAEDFDFDGIQRLILELERKEVIQ